MDEKQVVKIENKKVTLNLESSPMTTYIQEQRMSRDSLLAEASVKNLNNIFYSDISWRFGFDGQKNRNKNLIHTIFGETGTGKSNVLSYLCEYISKKSNQEFSVDHICFTRAEKLEIIKSKLGFKSGFDISDEMIATKRGMSFGLDEQKRGIFGVGASREREELKTIMDIIRKLQTYHAFLSPELQAMGVSHYYLEAWGIDYEKGFNKCIVYDKFMMPMGFILTRKTSDKIWQDYSLKKNKFISETATGTERASGMSSQRRAEDLLEDPLFNLAKSKGEKLVAVTVKYPNLAKTEVELIYSLAILISRAKKEGIPFDNIPETDLIKS